jgi:hypothetical protein
MSTWHKQVSKNLSDAVSSVLKDYVDQKATQNSKLKGKKGESVNKSKQALPEDDEETLDPVKPESNKNTNPKKTKTETISKAVRKTSSESKKVKLSKKKEDVKVNPTIGEQREYLREVLEASFDAVFKYGNKEEESFREQWMNEFSSLVTGKDPHAYIDPLQSKVLYIEGLTPVQAASRYLSACIANAAMSGGEYKPYGTRGGDSKMSAQRKGQDAGKAVSPKHQVKS